MSGEWRGNDVALFEELLCCLYLFMSGMAMEVVFGFRSR